MSKIDKTYHELLSNILHSGFRYEDPNRKGVYRLQIPDYKIVHNFDDGFPAITTKQLYWKGIVGELLWILRGDTTIKYLVDNNINIWNKDAYNEFLKSKPVLTKCRGIDDCKEILFEKDNEQHYNLWLGNIIQGKKENLWFGNIGRGYGAQLRNWKIGCNEFGQQNLNKDGYSYIDQFTELINTLKTNPMATKKTVTFWNPAEKDQCALTPCHWSFEILVEPLSRTELLMKLYEGKSISDMSFENPNPNKNIPKYKFTLKWHQHSVDTFLGLPFNIASYALLAQIIGKMTNMVPKGIIGDLSNVHIYEPHLDQVKEQLNRDVDKYSKCKLGIDYDTSNMLESSCRIFGKLPKEEQNAYLNKILSQINISDFTLKGYESYPTIKADMLAYSN